VGSHSALTLGKFIIGDNGEGQEDAANTVAQFTKFHKPLTYIKA